MKKFFKYTASLAAGAALAVLCGCSTTRKVPEGEYLLTRNTIKMDSATAFQSELEDYIIQKPNKKTLFLLPVGLWLYNMANPKTDSVLNEYNTYPSMMRNQTLRDSLFLKYNKPEFVGKNLFIDRFLHNVGQPPVILQSEKAQASANNLRKRMVYRGFWDTKASYQIVKDSAAKKAQVNYFVSPKQPTVIDGYYYNIPDAGLRSLYEQDLAGSQVLSGERLDQTRLETEIRRLNDKFREAGYYQFNGDGRQIYFTADTLASTKKVPLILEIHKDSLDTPYKVATIGNIDVAIVDKLNEYPRGTAKEVLRGITFHRTYDDYRLNPVWRSILLKTGERFQQQDLDNTRRNILAMNNFTILKARDSLRMGGRTTPNDSIVDMLYILKPLPKMDLKLAADVNYSQLLNLGFSPSVNFTVRNLFKGAENLTTSFNWITGTVRDSRDITKRVWANEFGLNFGLNIPRLLVPFSYWRVFSKRYTTTTSINLGASLQQNLGMDRINFTSGLAYNMVVNDVVSHRLTLLNTQLSITRNPEAYYDFFPNDALVRDQVFQLYSPQLYADFQNRLLTSDEYSNIILNDPNFIPTLSPQALEVYNTFRQSLINKDRQTQNVLIPSFSYNFLYNEIGKKNFRNPFYFSGKVEVSGNLLQLLGRNTDATGLTTGNQKTLFGVPVSQFVKFDVDVRKYFSFGKQTLALRQFIGLGIPYGNSNSMPFARSYFNGGANDIRAWRPWGGLGPADSQLDEKVRTFVMDNVKLTTSVEYRIPFNNMYEGAVFTDAGNVWSLRDNGFGDAFKFNKFLTQLGVGSGFGLRVNIAYITLRVDLAYKIYDPNQPVGERWRFSKFQPLKPTLNLAIGYPF